MTKIKRATVLILSVLLVLVMAVGCSNPAPVDTPSATPPANTEDGSAPASTAGEYKVAFICKFLTSVWFAPKSQAMQERADELGIIYLPVDANNNEDTFMQGLQNVINQGANGVILTPVNTAMLPATVDICKEAGVAYMTTDDGGVDSDGNRVPHLGLDDYQLGKDSAEAMVKAARERGFFENPSTVKVVMIDVPAVESFHNRLVGGYDVVRAAAPEIPDANYIWLDTIDGLLDNVIGKFSSQFQALAAGTERWIILGGDEGAPIGTFTVFEENGVDINNVILSSIVGSDMVDSFMKNETTGRAIFFSGILPGPSGVALIDVMADLFFNGVPIPEFTGYPRNVIDINNYYENFAQYLGS